jgi:hypothetical protein
LSHDFDGVSEIVYICILPLRVLAVEKKSSSKLVVEIYRPISGRRHLATTNSPFLLRLYGYSRLVATPGSIFSFVSGVGFTWGFGGQRLSLAFAIADFFALARCVSSESFAELVIDDDWEHTTHWQRLELHQVSKSEDPAAVADETNSETDT